MLGQQYLSATSVIRISFSDLYERSALVVEGEVSEVFSRLDPDNQQIWTHVRITTRDTLKGIDTPVLLLKFMGGTVGDLTQRVTEMQYPALGEHGVYFIESTTRLQIHPFVGWAQGHFKVHTSAQGEQLLHTAQGYPITNIDLNPRTTTIGMSSGVALGIQYSRETTDAAPISLDTFKTNLNFLRANDPTTIAQ